MRSIHPDIIAARHRPLVGSGLRADSRDVMVLEDAEYIEQYPSAARPWRYDERLEDVQLTVPFPRLGSVNWGGTDPERFTLDDDGTDGDFEAYPASESLSAEAVLLSDWNMDNEVSVNELMLAVEVAGAKSSSAVFFSSSVTVGEVAYYLAWNRRRFAKHVMLMGHLQFFRDSEEHFGFVMNEIRTAAGDDSALVWFLEANHILHNRLLHENYFLDDREAESQKPGMPDYLATITSLASARVQMTYALAMFQRGVWDADIISRARAADVDIEFVAASTEAV